MFAPFSRKTLGSIEKIVTKHSVTSTIKAPSCRVESSFSTRDKMIKFIIPEELKKKRLEELSFEELGQIVKR